MALFRMFRQKTPDFLLSISPLSQSFISTMASDEKPSSVLKYLYLGDKFHARDKECLKKLNITHILNCTPSREYVILVA